jgi:hypothetical protein
MTVTEIDLRPNDVILGRGGNAYKHPGNHALRELAKSFAHSYVEASKGEKFQISKRMLHVATSCNPPARFLRKIDQSHHYEEVDYAIAREKVCQCLRDAILELKLTPGSSKAPVGTSNTAKYDIDPASPYEISSISSGDDLCSVDNGKENITQSEPKLVYTPNSSLNRPSTISPDTYQGSSQGQRPPFNPYPRNQRWRDDFIPPPCYHPSSIPIVPSYPPNTTNYYHSPNFHPHQHQYPYHYNYHHYTHTPPPHPYPSLKTRSPFHGASTRNENLSLPTLTKVKTQPHHIEANNHTHHFSDDKVNLVSSMSSDNDMALESIEDLDLCYCKSTSRSMDSIDSFAMPF